MTILERHELVLEKLKCSPDDWHDKIKKILEATHGWSGTELYGTYCGVPDHFVVLYSKTDGNGRKSFHIEFFDGLTSHNKRDLTGHDKKVLIEAFDTGLKPTEPYLEKIYDAVEDWQGVIRDPAIPLPTGVFS